MSSMKFLPSLEQAKLIVASNENFACDVVEVDGHKLHMFRYKLPGFMDFDEPIRGDRSLNAFELRGTVFIEKPCGAVDRFLMLPKFFGFNETKGWMLKDLQAKKLVHCGDKLDGSVVRFLRVGDRLLAKTKTSINGPHADLALSVLHANPSLLAFVTDTLDQGLAAIFELLSPEFKILLDYPEPALRLLQLRDEATGECLDCDSHALVQMHGVAVTPSLGTVTLDDMIKAQATVTGVEGWVGRFDDGTMAKFKTVWYEDMHDLNFEKNRSDKKIAQSALNDTIDDALSMLSPEDPDRVRFETIRDLLRNEFNRLLRDTRALLALYTGAPDDKVARSAFAQSHRGSEVFGYAMFALANDAGIRLEQQILSQLRGRCKTERDATAFLKSLSKVARAA